MPLRLPFRFGAVTLTEAWLLHLAVVAEAPDGRRVSGFAADFLAPKWFDKDPARSHVDNMLDLVGSAQAAAEVYAQVTRTPRDLWTAWREAYPECRRRAAERGWNGLVAAFGSALFERALAEAAGRLAGLDVVGLLRADALGLRPAEIHPEIEPADWAAWVEREPPSAVFVRHTVGLVDPITRDDVGPGGGPADGLPVTLEEYVARHGLTHFKLKLGGQVEADLDRLHRIAAVLDRALPGPYVVTLDGNEQYRSLEEFQRLLDRLWESPALRRLAASIHFIEQPLERAVALDPAATAGLPALGRLAPFLIDESDDDLDAFPRAVALGYRGVSSKNCKGVVKAFVNRTLVEALNRRGRAGGGLFMSAEDLTNVPVVPLQQDLATVRALGLAHVERNGHHYVRGLDHCSAAERRAALRHHPDLYEGDEADARLAVRAGRLALGSLAVPGYGLAFDPDLASMTPLEAWKPERGLA